MYGEDVPKQTKDEDTTRPVIDMIRVKHGIDAKPEDLPLHTVTAPMSVPKQPKGRPCFTD